MSTTMAASTADLVTRAGLRAQRAYIEQIRQQGFDFGLVVGEAFVRGIRDLGYRHPGTALDELVDNSLQAGARNIHIAFGRGPLDDRLVSLAVVDDGFGIGAVMVRLAGVWGVTHREDERHGIGRH